ncbi:MAG: hypothetical protein K6U11_01945 [bacterium]|nr:hypothetical protein [bacterium]
MRVTKKSCFILMLSIIIVGFIFKKGECQYPVAPYPVLMPWIQAPPVPLFPAPLVPIPYSRAPQATIIISPGLTAVSPTAGTLVIGAPTVVTPTTAPTIISAATPTTTTTAAPAPLLSILAVLYTSALYSPTPLSVANPLLFAYLSSLIL